MAPIDDVLRRLADDPAFREAIDREPAAALREYPLTPDDLARVEDAVRSGPTPPARPGRSSGGASSDR